jgi:NAD(P)H-hydrate epimerase
MSMGAAYREGSVKVVSVEEMREIEAASDEAGHSYDVMMEQAGRGVAEALQDRVSVKGKRILVLVGPGNNGGDGLVAARYLAQAGAEVACYLTRERDPQEDENLRHIQELQIFCTTAGEDRKASRLKKLVAGADVIVDALLGTGTELPVRGTIAKVLQTTGRVLERRAEPSPAERITLGGIADPPQPNRPLILAVDGPSGLQFDTGALDEVALKADVTVTFAYPKRGQFRFPGAGAVGELVVADIGTDPALAEGVELEVLTDVRVRGWLPSRPPDAHKGSFGRALIVAGSSNYTGAARLAGTAAVRAGAGLVTLGLPAAIHSAIAAGLPEATYLLLGHQMGVLSEAAASVLLKESEDYDALLLGPGLGRERETVAFMQRLFAGTARRALGFSRSETSNDNRRELPPLIVDADGLNILSQMEDWPARLPRETILTPHPGEMGRLTGLSISEIQDDRVGVATKCAQEWGHVVLLKGAHTVVAAPDGRVVLAPFANAGLATAGTGDVLAGVIVALRAQGVGPFEATAAGAYLHGLAGELARAEKGVAGMAAGDLPGRIPAALQRMYPA